MQPVHGDAMTARHDTIQWSARKIASHEGKVLNDLPAGDRLAYETLANIILATVERKMAAQSKELAACLARDWEVPA
jgi:hypothetical protein